MQEEKRGELPSRGEARRGLGSPGSGRRSPGRKLGSRRTRGIVGGVSTRGGMQKEREGERAVEVISMRRRTQATNQEGFSRGFLYE